MEVERIRISLRDVIRHSAQQREVDIEGAFSLYIRPWAAVQLDDIQPLLVRLLKEFQALPKDTDALTATLKLLEKKEYFEDMLHIVYVTIERGNEMISISGKEYQLFTEDEMKKELPLATIWEIVKVIWQQNFEKNLSRGSKRGSNGDLMVQIAREVVETTQVSR